MLIFNIHNEKEKSITQLPINLNVKAEAGYKKETTVTRSILEFDPDKIQDGEVLIVKIPKYFGLFHDCYAVSNKDGVAEIKKLK